MSQNFLGFETPETIGPIYNDYRKEINNGLKYLRRLSSALYTKNSTDIIELLMNDSPMTVTDIYIRLRIEQSVCSQALRKLREVGIVNATRDGKFIYYRLERDNLDSILMSIEELSNF